MQGCYVILKVLMECSPQIASIERVTNDDDAKPDLLIKFDRSKLETVRHPAIGEFLKKLQITMGQMGDCRWMNVYVKQLKECACGKGDKMQDGICLCIHQLPVEVADLIINVIYTLCELVSLEAKTSNLEKKIADLKLQIQEITVWKDKYTKVESSLLLGQIAYNCEKQIKRKLLMGASIYSESDYEMNKYSLTLICKALFKRDPPIPGEFQFSENDRDVVKHNWEELNKKVIVDFRLLATLKSFKTSHNFDAHPTVNELDKVRQQLNEMSLLPKEKSEAENLIQIIEELT